MGVSPRASAGRTTEANRPIVSAATAVARRDRGLGAIRAIRSKKSPEAHGSPCSPAGHGKSREPKDGVLRGGVGAGGQGAGSGQPAPIPFRASGPLITPGVRWFGLIDRSE